MAKLASEEPKVLAPVAAGQVGEVRTYSKLVLDEEIASQMDVSHD